MIKWLTAYLLASLSRAFISKSLVGGYLGKLEGSQGRGFVVKNWRRKMKSNKITLNKRGGIISKVSNSSIRISEYKKQDKHLLLASH